eukprot:2274524-Rhodomonas_salina.4
MVSLSPALLLAASLHAQIDQNGQAAAKPSVSPGRSSPNSTKRCHLRVLAAAFLCRLFVGRHGCAESHAALREHAA